MSYRNSINEVEEFLANQREKTIIESSHLSDKSDQDLKNMLYEARLKQHSLVRGSEAERSNIRIIEGSTTILESRNQLDELSKTALNNYVSGALSSTINRSVQHGLNIANGSNDKEAYSDGLTKRINHFNKTLKRSSSIRSAVRKIASKNESLKFNDDDFYEYHPESMNIRNSYGPNNSWAREHVGMNSTRTPVPTSDGHFMQKGMYLKYTDIGKMLAEGSMVCPIKGHDYHTKSDSELRYIIKDAGDAAKAMKGHSPKSEEKYLDQQNDAATVLGYRDRGGKQIMKESVFKMEPKEHQKYKEGDSVKVSYHDTEGRSNHGIAKVHSATDAYVWVKHKDKFSGKDHTTQISQSTGKEPGAIPWNKARNMVNPKGHWAIEKYEDRNMKESVTEFHIWLGKEISESITTSDIVRGLSSNDLNVRDMARTAQKLRK